ncbi:MAG TPA: hypothetical protein VFW45_10755 [Candidatus Polarisedimenticolia bacterium]|nr:hypothetical protein [Candidatus Polarisedimenticolia bacterium]
MRDLLLGASLFAIAAAAALAIHPPAPPAQPTAVIEAAVTCADKNCPVNSHCCISCTGHPVCLKGGVKCPECAPQ